MHGQHDADLGAGDLGQPGDLALGVHAHLQHGHLVRGLEPQQRHRQAGLGVEVALVAQHAERPRQDVGHDLLGHRLAGRAGDADHPHRRTAAPPGRQLLQRLQAVRDLHDGRLRRRSTSTGRSTRATAAPLRSASADEAVAVDALTPQGHEAATRR